MTNRTPELDRYSARIEDLDADTLARDAANCGEEGAFLMAKARMAKGELERRMRDSGSKLLPTRDVLVTNEAKKDYDFGDGMATFASLNALGIPIAELMIIGTYTPDETKTVTVAESWKPSMTKLKPLLGKLSDEQRRAIESTFAVTERPNLKFAPINNEEMP